MQDNVLHIYPIANKDAKRAIFNMENVWHGLAEEVKFVQVLTEDEEEAAAEGKYPLINYNNETNNMGVDAALVNPDSEKNSFYLTEFPAKVTYNYGAISLPFVDNAWAKQAVDWITTGENIKVVFRNYVADCEIEWAGDVPTLFYPGASGKTDYISLSALKVTDWYGNAVNLAKGNDYFKTANVSIVLLTGDNVENEYYKAEIKANYEVGVDEEGNKVYDDVILFTSKVNKSQGNAVPTTLKVIIKDNFGYEVSKSDLAPFSMSFTK